MTAGSALAAGATPIHDDGPGNLAFDYEYGDRDSTEPGFRDAAHVVRVALHAQRISGNPMEPKSCTALYDAAADTYDVCIPTQGISDMRNTLSGMTGLAPEKFRIHSNDVGGAFGVRNEVYPEFLAVMLAAKRTGKPVKWHGTRSETHLRRPSGARRRSDRRTCARRPRQVPRAARRVAGQSRRVFLQRRPADQHGRGPDQLGHEPLQDRRALRPSPAGVHQHDADHGLSRRRPPQRRLSLGAAGRGGGAGDRGRSGYAAPAQSPEERRVPAEDADRLVL